MDARNGPFTSAFGPTKLKISAAGIALAAQGHFHLGEVMLFQTYNTIIHLSCSGIWMMITRIADGCLTMIVLAYLLQSQFKNLRGKVALLLIVFISIVTWMAAVVAGVCLTLGALHWISRDTSIFLAAVAALAMYIWPVFHRNWRWRLWDLCSAR